MAIKSSLRRGLVWTWIAVLAGLCACLRVFVLPGINIAGENRKVFADTYWLFRNVYLHTEPSAQAITGKALEGYLPLALGPIADLSAAVSNNIALYLSIYPPRYAEIFESRPVSSLILAPFLLTFGSSSVGWVIAAGAATAAVLAAILATRLTRRTLSEAPLLATFTLIAFFVLPPGAWGSVYLFEGFAYVFAISIVILGVLILQRHPKAYMFVWLLALIGFLGLATKSSLIMPILVMAIIPLAWRAIQARGHDGLMNFSTGAVTGALMLWTLLGQVLNWPGLNATLQDTFTNHFTLPDIADPIQQWWLLLKASSKSELLWALDFPAIPIAFILILVLAMQRFGLASVFVFGFLFSAIAQFFVHPVFSELERFIAVGWLVVVVAGPCILLELFEDSRVKRRSGYLSWRLNGTGSSEYPSALPEPLRTGSGIY